ncbi:hypothetical protein TNCV_1732791 [Trichonephila clavipes]|nr:hypothetical protein TNCV_1732791 [Trichonephila clavipes]
MAAVHFLHHENPPTCLEIVMSISSLEIPPLKKKMVSAKYLFVLVAAFAFAVTTMVEESTAMPMPHHHHNNHHGVAALLVAGALASLLQHHHH